jgi:hypothetical protein
MLVMQVLLIRLSNHSLVGCLLTVVAVGSGGCFTTACVITDNHSGQTVANGNTAGLAAAKTVAATPLTLTA